MDISKLSVGIVNNELISLAQDFSVNEESCANPTLYTQYLLYEALPDLQCGRATTHIFIDDEANKVVGYISLKTNSLIYQHSNNKFLGEPALEIYMLAVDQNYTKRGIGTMLLNFAIAEADLLRQKHAGVKYIILAADEQAVSFYEKSLFVPLSSRWDTMSKELRNKNCFPMVLELQFDTTTTESYDEEIDDDDIIDSSNLFAEAMAVS